MIIPLFLFGRRILSGPNFYMSAYLEARRDDYIERMRAVSRDGAWTEWCIFFLEGLIDQARENQSKAEKILALYQSMLAEVARLTHSQHAARATEMLFSHPVFNSPSFSFSSEIPGPTASRILAILRDEGVIRALLPGAGRRATIYVFPDLINIVEGRAVF